MSALETRTKPIARSACRTHTVVGLVEQNETRHNDPNHAVVRDAEKRAPHGGVKQFF